MNSARYDVQSDVRFLLPLRPGQSVALIGAQQSLMDAVECDGMKLSVPAVSDGTLIMEPSSVDHLIAVDPALSSRAAMLKEFARVVKRGGSVFIGISNAASLQFLMRRFRGMREGAHGLTLQRAITSLEEVGFKPESYYGIHTDLSQPSFVVPLEGPHPSHYYFSNVYVPYSLPSVLSRQSAFLLIRLGLQQLLFADLGLVARRI
jgi:hypothetical protein